MNDVGAQTAQHGRKRRWYGDVRPAAMLWLLLAGAMQPLAVAEPAQTVVDRSQVNAGQMDLCFLTNTCSVGGQSYASKVGSCTASPGGDPSACEADGPASQSRTDAGSAAGNPIDVATGNKYQKEVDIAALPGVLGLEVVRHYNSRYAQGETKPGILGRGWKLSYETRLYRVGETLQIVQADGTRLIFNRDANNPSQCGTGDATHGRVVIEARGEAETYQWVWTHGASAGRRLYFDERGWLTRIEAPGGEAVSLEYTEAGLLSRVTDPQGRALKVHYPEEKTRDAWRFPGAERIETPAGEIKYSYGQLPEETSLPTYREDEPVQPTEVLTAEEEAAAKKRKSWVLANLERVEWPANGAGERSAVRIYHYEDERYPNLLTGISVAELGSKAERISRYGYDKQGLAKLSERLASGERVELTELAPSKLAGEPGHTVLTDGQGKSTSYRHAQIGGRGRLLETRGAGCPGCSPAERRYVYDTVGREVEVIQLDSSGRAESGVRKEYDDWGRLTGIGQVTYGAGAEAPQWHPLFGVWRLQQTEIQTSDETNEAERVEWLIRYDYAAPQVDEKSGALLALEKPMRITRPSVVEGKEHRIELEYNDAWQVTKVIETGYSPAVPTSLANPELPKSGPSKPDDDGFIKASTTSAGLVGWEERSGSQQNSRDNLNSEASVGWAKQAQRSVPTRTAVTNQPEIPTRNTSTNTDGGFVGWEERSGSQQQSAADLVVAKSSGTNISKTTLSEGLQGNFVRAKCSGTLDSTGRSDCPRLITRTTEYRYRKVNGRSVLVAIDGPLPNGSNGPLAMPTDSDIVRIFWDKQGDYPVRVFMPGGATRAFERDAAGRVVTTAFNDGYRHVEYKNTYTARGVLTEHTRRAWKSDDPRNVLSETQHYQTDLHGRLIAATAADGSTQQLAYDGQGRLSGYTAPGGERIEWRYDGQNRPLAQIVFDAQGEVSRARMTVRDDLGRVLATLSPEGIDTFNPISPTLIPVAEIRGAHWGEERRDAAGRHYRVWRDDFDRTVATLSPDDGLVVNHYENSSAGERQTQVYLGKQPPAKQTDFKRTARWETLTFDIGGRLVQREHPGCTEKLIYQGRLLSRLESCGSQQHFERDAFGLITEHRQDLGDKTFRETYRYDATGKLVERTTAGGARLAYRYDTTGRLSSVLKQREDGWRATLADWLPQSWAYQPVQSNLQWQPLAGTPSGATYGNGAHWQDTYDRSGRLSEYRLETRAGTIYQAKTHWYQNKPVRESRNGQAYTRLYDPEGRLLPAGLDPNGLENTHPWLLPASLRTAETGAVDAPADSATLSVSASKTSMLATPTQFYTADGQRTSAWKTMNPGSAQGITTIAFEDPGAPERNSWGEQVARRGQHLIWDAEGHLSAIEQNGRRVASYQYDARGMRIGKTLHTATGDVQTFYLYDINQRLSAEADGTGRIVREYLYNGTRPYALLEDGHTYAIYSDARGLPLYMLDETQQVVWQGHWDDWGGAAETSASTLSSAMTTMKLELRLAGQYHDGESGLYYNIHRYYDPEQGTYISPDPLGDRIGEHRYAYLDHDPLSGTDPQGLFKIPTTSVGGNLTTSITEIDKGHADIVNAAFALYAQQVGEVRFSRTIIDQIILNNFHTDAKFDWMFGTRAGQDNTLNHFDNPNKGLMYKDADRTEKYESYTDGKGDNWVQDALNQINKNRGAYESRVPTVRGTLHFLTLYSDISEHIGRLGQNLHTLADFYAHTNWVDSAERGKECYKELVSSGRVQPNELPPGHVMETVVNGDNTTTYKVYKVGYVPVGREKTTLWDEKVPDGIFSGTAHSLNETFFMTDVPYTHAYWNKDSSSTPGGKEAVDSEKLASDQYYWKAIVYSEKNLKKALGNETPVLGENYVTETGLPPKEPKFTYEEHGGSTYVAERVYVRTPITNKYELAMSLAIEHTIQEIDRFYQAAGSVQVGDKTLQDILKLDKVALEEHKIKYDAYPDKMSGYGG